MAINVNNYLLKWCFKKRKAKQEVKKMDEREELYLKIEERIGGELGREIVSAIKYLYKRFDRRMLKWAADLYDYEIGGFYYSNSARDTDGYLPDIESTWDFIVLPYSLGGMKKYGDTLESAIAKGYPEWFKERVVSYFLSLQEPDGLYYHPQWEHDKHTISRLGRDRGSANTIIRAFGSSPKYELARVGSDVLIREDDLKCAFDTELGVGDSLPS